MSSRSLYRLSGGTLIVSSILIIVNAILGGILYPGHNTTPSQLQSITWQLITLLTLVWSLLFVIALPGMYSRQAKQARVLGLVGFILLFFGILLEESAFSALQVIVLPFLAQVAPHATGNGGGPVGVFLLLLISGLLHIIGAILLGVATLRAKVFPRGIGILLIVSGIALLLTIPPLPDVLDSVIEAISFVAFAIAFLWSGYILVSQERTGVEAKTFATAETLVSR